MLLRPVPVEDTNHNLEEKIRNEIIAILQKKGIKVSQVHIDLSSGSVNISLSIGGK